MLPMSPSTSSISFCGPRTVGRPPSIVAPRHSVASAAVKPLVNIRKSCTVSATAPPHEHHQQGETGGATSRKPSAMPRLPDRPAKRSSSGTSAPKADGGSSSSSSSRSSPKPRRPLPPSLPPEQQQQAQERTLAGLLAYSGLLGTVATVTSVVAPDVDLFGGFQLVPADIILGLQLLVPCCLLNLAIMLPDYSSWKVPEEPTLEAQQKMAEALLAWTANKKAAADAASKPAAAAAAAVSDVDSAGSSSNSSSAAYISDSSESSSSSSSQDRQEIGHSADSLPQPAVASSSSSSDGADEQARSLPAGMSPPWMINNPDPPLPLPLARCKDALLMAQGHYLSSTPRVALPWPMQVGVLLVNCMAAELLYRSVLLQVLGGWLTDRTLEAGAEDWFLAAAAHLPVLPTPHITGQLTALSLLSAAWGLAVVQQVLRMSRRPSMVMASQGRAAAGKLMQDMQRLAGGPGKTQQQQQDEQGQQEKQGPDQQQQQAGDSSRHAAGSEEEASTSNGGSAPASSASAPLRSKEAAKLALAAAADPAAPSSAGSSRPSRQGLAGGLPNTLGALALSQAVTGVRDLSQFVGLGLAFALTGNLAAPFVAAVVTDGLMAVLQRRGQERSRQRSIAFAKHFASFTRVLRDVQRQQTLKQGSAQEQSAPGSPEQQADTPPFTRSSGTLDDATAAAMPLASTSSLASSAGDDDALDAAVTAAVAVPDAAALHAAAAAAVKGEEAAGAAAGSPAGGSSRMESTINLLDQLVVEQLTERAAAAGPHK